MALGIAIGRYRRPGKNVSFWCVFLFDLAGGREAERAMRNKVIMFLCRCGSHGEAIKVNRADQLLSLKWFNAQEPKYNCEAIEGNSLTKQKIENTPCTLSKCECNEQFDAKLCAVSAIYLPYI